MDPNSRASQEALAYVRLRFPSAAMRDLSGTASSYLEARGASVCAKTCTGAENCRFKGYKPVLCEEEGAFVVRWGRCRSARRPEQPKEAPLCPVPAHYAPCSFENFRTDAHPGLPTLLKAAKTSAEQSINLFFIGPSATGKTHLAAACARTFAESGKSVLFFTGTEYFERLRASFHGGPEIEARTRAAGLVVFDDICASKLSEWSSKKFAEALDHRYGSRLPTIVTSGAKSYDAFAEAAGTSGRKCMARLMDRSVGISMNLAAAPAYISIGQTELFPAAEAGLSAGTA